MNGNNLNKKEQLKKGGRLDWKKGVEITKQHQTIIEVVKRLADK